MPIISFGACVRSTSRRDGCGGSVQRCSCRLVVIACANRHTLRGSRARSSNREGSLLGASGYQDGSSRNRHCRGIAGRDQNRCTARRRGGVNGDGSCCRVTLREAICPYFYRERWPSSDRYDQRETAVSVRCRERQIFGLGRWQKRRRYASKGFGTRRNRHTRARA